jgi:hypothetical protein
MEYPFFMLLHKGTKNRRIPEIGYPYPTKPNLKAYFCLPRLH